MQRRLVVLFLLVGCAGAPVKPASGGASPVFIENDLPRALAESARTGKPLFVDVFTHWCHICSSMRAYVFPDPLLRAAAPQFIWATVDGEDPRNADFLGKHPVEGYPTMFVLDARSGEVVRTWLGGYPAPDLASRLDETLAQLHGDSRGALMTALSRGERELSDGQLPAAKKTYQELLTQVPAGSPLHPRVVAGLATVLDRQQDAEGCVALLSRELPSVGTGPEYVDVATSALDCASSLPEKDARRDALWRESEARLEAIVADSARPLLADDRSTFYAMLVSSHRERKDDAGAQALARTWRDFLEQAAAHAPDAPARAVFDSHRILAYTELGEVGKAVPMLKASEAALPADFMPSARLAKVYLKLGDAESALAAAMRAEKKAYGPSRVYVLESKAEAYAKLGNTTEANAVLNQAERDVAAMPPAQNPERVRKQLEARRKTLGL